MSWLKLNLRYLSQELNTFNDVKIFWLSWKFLDRSWVENILIKVKLKIFWSIDWAKYIINLNKLAMFGVN